MRWVAGLAAAVLLPACGNGSEPPPVAIDEDGRTPQGTVEDLGSGQPPFIRIVRPGPRTTVHEGATITIQAVAVDPNALIARVNFYDGNRLVGGKNSPPFAIPVGGLTPGSHVFTAVAIDVEGITATSAPVTVHVLQREASGDEDDD